MSVTDWPAVKVVVSADKEIAVCTETEEVPLAAAVSAVMTSGTRTLPTSKREVTAAMSAERRCASVPFRQNGEVGREDRPRTCISTQTQDDERLRNRARSQRERLASVFES